MSEKNIPQKLLSGYNPSDTESRIYSTWEESGYFNPDNLPGNPTNTFTIVLPPPNVTGTLHMGSALMLAIEDTMVRFARMNGKRVLWIPGTDSAAIATQSTVEKAIQKSEKKSRHDLGREELLKRIDIFVDQNKNTMLSQMRAMGASLDWSRYAYTMDETRYKAVMEAFVRMYQAGLIYRGNRIVNWDPKGQTTISDDEIVHEERESKMYTFKYSKDFPITISTTRPETKVGDTAVAVHPDDTRYSKYIGETYNIIFCDVAITVKIIADTAVEKDFGTGALGVTPAHSQTDWEIADRHDLPRPQVINEYAKMTVDGRLKDKKTTEARELVVEWLKEQNLLEKEEVVTQNISTAERTGGIVEPLPKLQWFIDVNKDFTIPYSEITGIETGSKTTLKKIMLAAVEHGQTSFVSKQYEKVYFNWVNNLRPWCISRQIWFGHRIPVWYKENEIYVGIESPAEEGWTQDSDVLDTWFSSGLWTFSTLGWPEETVDLKKYHPTEIIESGYDILPFWICRMILMSGFFLGQVPFKKIYLHGLVRDGQGRKISKSLGNNIDPVDMAAKYGMDAVRMSLIVGTAAGTDSKVSEDKIKGYRNFANKMWNATRFVLERTNDFTDTETTFVEGDQKIIDTWLTTKKEITEDIEEYRLHLASEKIYGYFWHTFCDEIIETCKTRILEDIDKASAQKLLITLLEDQLKVLHPFMPFVTEELWNLLGKENLLMIEPWNN